MKRLSVIGVSFFVAFVLLLSGVNTLRAQEITKAKKSGNMHTYLIKLPHTPETCLISLDEISDKKPELLNKIDWGCMSGDHTGYMTVKSKDEKSALAMLPATLMKNAKIEKVDKFTKEQIRSFHKKKE